MRYALFTLGLVVCIGVYEGWFAQIYDHVTMAALSDDARLALELRCGDDDDRSTRDCRAMLKKLYLSGSLDPDRTLRTYCEQFEHGRWGGSRPPPPAVCVERYGGWQAG